MIFFPGYFDFPMPVMSPVIRTHPSSLPMYAVSPAIYRVITISTHCEHSSVSTVTRIRAARQRFDPRQEGGEETFSLRHRVQTRSGAHPASNPMGIGCYSPEVSVAGT